jgi:hypothetical protein
LKQINYLFILFTCFNCNNLKQREEFVFIPEGYEGDVHIFYNVDTSKSQYQTYKDRIIFTPLIGNSGVYTINQKNRQEGYYNIRYFYFGKDKFYQINSDGCNEKNIPKFPTVTNAGNSGKNMRYFTVYKDSISILKYDSLKQLLWPIRLRDNKFKWAKEDYSKKYPGYN